MDPVTCIYHLFSSSKNTVSTDCFKSIVKSWYVLVSILDKHDSNSLIDRFLHSMATELDERGRVISSFPIFIQSRRILNEMGQF